MKLSEFNKVLSSKKFGSMYLFYGEETGLLHEYLATLKENFTNIITSMTIEDILEDTKFNSIFGGAKLYVLEDSGWFNKKIGEDSVLVKLLMRFMKGTTNTIVFAESKVDTKLNQFQALSEDNIVEFSKLAENQLVKLVQTLFKSEDKSITKDLANYVVDQCDYNYSRIVNECDKLINYIEKKSITLDDIKQVVSRSTNAVVFDMVSYIVKQKYDRALDMYDTLILRKESPLGVLALFYRQLKLLYQIKLLVKEGYSDYDIAEACDSRQFIIQKNKNLCSFDTNKLLKLMVQCSETDYKIKSGQMKDISAVKLLIIFSALNTKDMEEIVCI